MTNLWKKLHRFPENFQRKRELLKCRNKLCGSLPFYLSEKNSCQHESNHFWMSLEEMDATNYCVSPDYFERDIGSINSNKKEIHKYGRN